MSFKKSMVTVLGILCITAFFSTTLFGQNSALDQAKALAGQKKYDDALKALEKELENKNPNLEVMKFAMETNLLIGKPVSANLLATELLKITENKDMDIVFRAGEIAELCGDDKLALSRYHNYLTKYGVAGPKLDKAVSYLFMYSNYADAYAKALETSGAELNWRRGLDLISWMSDTKSINDLVIVLRAMLKTYSDSPDVVSAVMQRIWDKRANFNKDANTRILDVMMSSKMPEDTHLHAFYEYIRHAYRDMDNGQKFRWGLAYVDSNKKLLPDEFFSAPAAQYIESRANDEQKQRAAKDMAARLPIIEKSKWREGIRSYVQTMANMSDKFKTLVTPEQLGALTVACANLYSPGFEPHEVNNIVNAVHHVLYKDDKENQLKYLKAIAPVMNSHWARVAVSLKPEEAKDTLAAYLAPVDGFQRDLRELQILPQLREAKIKAKYAKALRTYILTGNFDVNTANNELHNGGLLTPAERVKIVSDVAAMTGSSTKLTTLIKAMEGNNELKAAPGFDALKTFADSNKAGTNAVFNAANKVFNIPNAQTQDVLDKAVEEFLKVYKGGVPAASFFAKNLEEYVAMCVYQHNAALYSDTEALNRMALRWAPRFSTHGEIWNGLISAVWSKEGNDHKNKTSFKLLEYYAKIIAASKDNANLDLAGYFHHQINPEKKDISIMTPLYSDYPSHSMYYIINSGAEFTAAFYFKQLEEILKDMKGKLTYSDINFIRHNAYNGPHKAAVPETFAIALMRKTMDVAKRRKYIDMSIEAQPYAIYGGTGSKNYVQEYIKLLKTRTPYLQIRSISEFFMHSGMHPQDASLLFEEALKPLLALPANQWKYAGIDSNIFNAFNYIHDTKNFPEDVRKNGIAIRADLARALLSGKARYSEWSHVGYYVDAMSGTFIEDLKKQSLPEQTQSIATFSQILTRDNDQGRGMRVTESSYKGFQGVPSETQYVFLSNLIKGTSNFNKAAKNKYMLIISKLAKDIPGVLPVDKNDQAYDLFLAAQQLKQGNALNAWALVRPKTAILKDRWKEMDYDFVIWALEQTRKQRMYKEALEVSMTMWLDEQELQPEDAARLGLVKGDIYRDSKNFPAARIEYESLKNTSRYRRTIAGDLAKFRLVELLILTQDYSSARLELERLVDSGSINEQAEAYYLMARLEFEQGELDSASDNLKQVFRRVTGHPEGRLLDGEISLKKGVIKDPFIPVGDTKLQTIAIPGKELIFQIQDSNLSIVRGGKSIPIVVTTTVGKDRETLELLPNANNTNLFSGTIMTALGKPTHGNLLLELTASDEIIYQIDPEFQKTNNLNYASKKLEIRYPAKLYASSKKVLSEEEQEELSVSASLALSAGIRDRNANSKIIRPGSPLYVRVVDYAMSRTPDKQDTVSVDVTTSSGDEIRGLVLTETGPYTGIFEAIVPTGIPFPNAYASDSVEGIDINAVINSKKTGTWRSLSDGRKPKWLEVDTMTSHNFKEVEIAFPDPKTIKSFTLTASLDQREDVLSSYPQNVKKNNGGLIVQSLPGNESGMERIMSRFLRGGATESWVKDPVIRRVYLPHKGRNGSYMYDINGSFWLEQNEEVEFKFLQPADNNQYAYLLIDNTLVIGGQMNEVGIASTRTLFLNAGLHQIRILGRDYSQNSQIMVGMAQKDGTFRTLPEDWFNPEKYPEFAETLKPKGRVTETKEGFRIVLNEPARYRKLKFTFEDYNGSQVEVSGISAKDNKGNDILPVPEDLSTGKNNNILEIAAGDTIGVTYSDEKYIDENKATISAELTSSFHNATIELSYEEIKMNEEGYPVSTLTKAKRVQKGDSVIVVVVDYDEDISDESQTVPVEILTSSGEKLQINLLESNSIPGRFTQVFKTGDRTGNGMIKIESGDTITARYLDKENNSPGIPVYREYSIMGIEGSKPDITVFAADITRIEDKSASAMAKIKSMRDRGDKREDIKIYKDDISASPIRIQRNADPNVPIFINSKAPLMVEITYPEMAKHLGSIAELRVLTGTEVNAAKAENRQPRPLLVRAPLKSLATLARTKGYPVTLPGSSFMSQQNVLDLGLFAAVIRLQLGSSTDEINDIISSNETFNIMNSEARDDDDAFKVPTVIVSGSDTITLTINDKAGKELAKRIVKLRSDGELGLYDKNFLTFSDSIHLGQSFYVKVYDPDRDVSDDLDRIEVNVVSKGGDKLTMNLSETLPHSGVFTGVLKTEPKPKAKEDGSMPEKSDVNILWTQFGDTVTFTYVDKIPLKGDKPVEISASGKVVIGSDGEVSTFTKKFKDPDMAVKTNFLMAEALFEMAKSHRSMKKEDLAQEEIARGKRILEEALRDYPNTSLKAQGEFLLANLAQQLNNFQEAIGRYSVVISNWPESEYAVKSQFQKAQCLEKMGQGLQACEEYVKLTYLFPDSPLASDAKIRLGNYYYKEKKFRAASMIFKKFAENHPAHQLAAKSLFLAGNSELRHQMELVRINKENNQTYRPDYTDAIKIFSELVEKFQDDKDIRAEGMYWLGDSYFKSGTVEGQEKSYQVLKRLTWDYPESKWAKIARGRMAEQPER